MKNMTWKKISCLFLCLFLLCSMLASCGKSESLNDEEVEIMNESTSGSTGTDHMLTGDQIADSAEGEKQEDTAKIIRTVGLYAETQHFDDAISEIETAVTALGGYVGTSNIQGANLYQKTNKNKVVTCSADYTLRIPAEKLDEFLTTAGEAVHITSTESTATDVTSEYYDIEARLSVLETERQVLERMLAESTNVSNMISVEERLYDVIYEIESYESALRVYDHKVAYSTVTLHLREVTDLTVSEESFGTRVKNAIAESWSNVVEGVQDFFIALIYGFPVLLILGIAAGVIVTIVVRAIKRNRNKKFDGEGMKD
ncbi:MAG: DUF4349 domain-containing protein [Clostridia bacterium]|nr:DUF4349 domain-containing protein [Clostridia bacterium]